jgi:hypothetical protein
MVTQQFLRIIAWSLSIALLIAVLGLAISKIWVLQVDMSLWAWSWIGGSLVAGLLAAAVWTYLARRAPIEAAIELDQRFQLKERVSSALILSASDMQTDAGRALLNDAVRSVGRIDVRDNFPVRMTWHAFLPLLPAALIFVLVTFVPDAVPPKNAAVEAKTAVESEQVKRSAEELQKRLERAKEKASAKGLDEAELLFKQIQNGISDLANRNDVNKKKALVKINDLAQTIEQRRQRFGGADKLRDKLNQLKDLTPGPANKISQAMKEGDFQKALDELKNLQDKLRNGELNAEEERQLAEQLEQLQNKLQDMVNAHEEAKRALEEEIQRKKDAGDLHEAGKLQKQLDALNQMNNQMRKLQDMAEGLGQCQQCMKNGDAQGAAAQLDQLADSLQEMQAELDQLETLDEMLDEIAMAKEAMNCKQCAGGG